MHDFLLSASRMRDTAVKSLKKLGFGIFLLVSASSLRLKPFEGKQRHILLPESSLFVFSRRFPNFWELAGDAVGRMKT